MPFATDEAIATLKVSTTLPPPGIVKTPQLGFVAPTLGLVVEGRVAPPFKVTETVELNVNPDGNASEIFRFVASPRFAALATVIVYVAVFPMSCL